MFDLIMQGLQAIWDFLKKIWVKICSFFGHIVKFFKNPERLKKLRENRELLAVSIKEKLNNNEFQVINCLFNKEEGKLVNPEEDVEIINAENLDSQTIQSFGDKEMIVLS